ncbi:HAUS6-like protein [Mya arenaria]|uniref:HAUS6-like protein n=1 Tax=Mya arenaria TaxID=6604 RepID=A0ABY7DUW5_MYAAR|nr:HAUS6-like protein [Mya arenaria]
MDMENNNLDMKQLFFNNLHLLGFDSPAMEATHSIPFNKSMFELPNKRGAEIVLHFLFQRLNPTMCKEAFRDSWPIHDKKREQTFRKTCSNWLTNILQKAMENELGVKAIERQKWPTLTSQNQSIQDAIHKSLVCSGIRHRNQYFDTVNLNVQASKTWKNTADEYVYEYRKLSKELRELEYKMRDEEHKAHMAATDRGSPSRKQRSTEHFDPEFDPRTIKRAQRMQQVRDMWKQLEDFDRSESAEREVVESIVERTINKHRIDGSNINVKVPDMLLRECHDEIIKMAERIPEMKASVEQLREQLDTVHFRDVSPESIRSTSLGVGLVRPSPQATFSPTQAKTPDTRTAISSSPRQVVDTPEAASVFHDQVKNTVRKGLETLFDEPDLLKKMPVPSTIPRPHNTTGSRHSSRPTSAHSTVSSTGGKSSVKSTPKSSKSIGVKTGKDKRIKTSQKSIIDLSFTKPASPRTLVESWRSEEGRVNRGDVSDTSLPLSTRSDLSSDHTLTGGSPQRSTPRSEESFPAQAEPKGRVGRRTPTDFLVDEIMGEGVVLSPYNSGLEAFESKQIIQRTPDLNEDIPECVTPANTEERFGSRPDTEDEQIVNITGPQMQDAEMGDESPDIWKEIIEDGNQDPIESSAPDGGSNCQERLERTEEDLDRMRVENILARAGQFLKSKDSNVKANVCDKKAVAFSEEKERSGVDNLVIEENDMKVNEMILEGIRQATEDNDYEDDEVSNKSETTETDAVNRSDRELRGIDDRMPAVEIPDDGREDEIEEIAGPELEDVGELSDTSERSTEQVIIIDRSLHHSPRPTAGQSQFPADEDWDGQMIEDEMFAGLESSPREAIIIDRSFQYTPVNRSIDVRGQVSTEACTPEKISQKARSTDQRKSKLKVADISWDLTENLEDIELPDDLDSNIDDLVPDSVDLSGTMTSLEIVDVENEDNIDDFFSSKTPEMPKRGAPVGQEAGQGDAPHSLGDSGSNWPLFPQGSGIEDEIPLMAFTP